MATEIYRSSVSVDCQGQNAAIVMHWKCIDPTSSNDVILAKQLNDALRAGVAPLGYINRLVLLMSDDVFVSKVDVIKIHPTGGNTWSHTYQRADEPGGIDSPWHTGQLAGVPIWITSGRPNVTGRNFIPGVPESMIEGGRFVDDYQTAMQNFMTTCITGFSTANALFQLVLWDREVEVSYLVDDSYLGRKPGTQRRREKPL